MESYSPPSPTRPQADSFTTDDPETHYQEPNPHSFSAVIGDRPFSGSETQPHNPKTIEPPVDITTAPALTDVAPDKGYSYYENSSRDVNQYSEGPLSVGGFAGERVKHSEYDGEIEYENENVKIPSEGDVRQIDHSSGYDESEYQMSSGPKSYNSDHFGKFKW